MSKKSIITKDNINHAKRYFNGDYSHLSAALGDEDALQLVLAIHESNTAHAEHNGYHSTHQQTTILAPISFSAWNKEGMTSYQQIKDILSKNAADKLASYMQQNDLPSLKIPDFSRAEKQMEHDSIINDFKALLALPDEQRYKQLKIPKGICCKDSSVFFEFASNAEYNKKYPSFSRLEILEITRDIAIKYSWAKYHSGGYDGEEDIINGFEKSNINSFIQHLYDKYLVKNGRAFDALIAELQTQTKEEAA